MNTSDIENNKINKVRQRIFYVYSNLLFFRDRLLSQFDDSYYSVEASKELGDVILDLLNSMEVILKWDLHFKLDETIGNLDFTDGIWQIENKINYIFRALTKITCLLKFIEGAHDNEIPWRLCGPMSRLSKELIPDSKLIIRPQWQFNYDYTSISSEISEAISLISKIKISLGETPYSKFISKPYFYSLSYPPESGKDILNMSIWSHEFGHCLDNHEGLSIKQDFNDFYSKKLIRDYFHNNEINKEEVDRLISKYKTEFSEEDEEAIRTKISSILFRTFESWSKEIFADIVSIRLFGYSFLFSFVYLSKSLEINDQFEKLDNRYPPNHLRIKTMISTLKRGDYKDWEKNTLFNEYSTGFLHELQYAEEFTVSSQSEIDYENLDLSKAIDKLITSTIENNFDNILNLFNEYISKLFKEKGIHFRESSKLLETYKTALQNLTNDVPIDFEINNTNEDINLLEQISIIFNSGWIYWLYKKEKLNFNLVMNYDEILEEYSKINRIIEKSFEILEAELWYRERKIENLIKARDKAIKSVREKNKFESVKVLPLLDPIHQIDDCSIDVRLGNEFIETLLPYTTKIDPAELGNQSRPEEFQTKIYLPFGKPYVLHPNKFVLGSTLEYLVFPKDFFGFVVGRSSWGRIGLIIATASKVDPLFKGCITLEITNLGNVPILLYPGSRIGQLTIHKVI